MKLLDLLNRSPFDFYFLVVDPFLDIDLPQLNNFFSVSPAKFNITLDAKNSGKLLSHPAVLDFIKNNSAKSGRKPAIIPFKPSAKIDLICRQNGWVLIGNPSPLNRLFEDKIKFYDICTQSNLPVVPSLILPFNQENYQLAQKKYRQELVLQTHFGWAGNSSYVSHDWSDIDTKIPHQTIVKISPFLSGYSLINNCCLTKNGLIQSPPGIQYTGIAPLTKNPLGTVGRQWPSFTPPEVDSQINQLTQNFSAVLKQYNYRGFFGLDFLVSQNKVYLLECNPRLTASFAFYTALELAQNLTPLFFLHLAEFIDLDLIETDHFSAKLLGSEITAKDSHGATLAKFQDQAAFITRPDAKKIDPHILSHVL